MRRSLGTGLGIAALFLSAPELFAQAHGPHVHGSASLEVTVDGPTLSLRLTTPLENLLGFEHAPRTAQQKKAVSDMAASLRKAEAHFMPAPAARCTAGSVTLDSPVLRDGNTASQKDVHAELTAEYTFRCEQPEQLRGVEVRLFDAFRRLQRMDVQLAAPGVQKSYRLTSRQRLMAW